MSRVLCFLFVALTSASFAQTPPDTVGTDSPSHFYSVGFNASSASGIGLSLRHKLSAYNLLQITGGLLRSSGRTDYSLGFEYQYQLSKKPTFRYYLSFGAGLYSDIQNTSVVGFGMGLELPMVGTTIFEGVTAGGCLFYPVFNPNRDPTIGVGGSIFLFYNF